MCFIKLFRSFATSIFLSLYHTYIYRLFINSSHLLIPLQHLLKFSLSFLLKVNVNNRQKYFFLFFFFRFVLIKKKESVSENKIKNYEWSLWRYLWNLFKYFIDENSIDEVLSLYLYNIFWRLNGLFLLMITEEEEGKFNKL